MALTWFFVCYESDWAGSGAASALGAGRWAAQGAAPGATAGASVTEFAAEVRGRGPGMGEPGARGPVRGCREPGTR